MSKRISFTRLHYGADFLRWVIKSTEGLTDEHVIMYTPTPTFGRGTDLPNPDSRDELYAIAEHAANGRLRWFDGFPHVQPILEMYPDADAIIELDADEVISEVLRDDIAYQLSTGKLAESRYRMPFVHHWRSFDYVCTDGQWPIRLYRPTQGSMQVDPAWYSGDSGGVYHHFGYARKLEDMRYKLELSVHHDEFRQGWWENTFLAFPQVLTDLHPGNIDFWNAERIERSRLPNVLRDHPYWDLEVIK